MGIHQSEMDTQVEENGYDPNELRTDFIQRMLNEGYDIVYPDNNELQIDIDTEDQYTLFKSQWEILVKNLPEIYGDGLSYTEHESKGGYPGRHITVSFPPSLTKVSRIMWQAVLGSDPIRELLSAIRHLKGDDHPTLFVEKI